MSSSLARDGLDSPKIRTWCVAQEPPERGKGATGRTGAQELERDSDAQDGPHLKIAAITGVLYSDCWCVNNFNSMS